MTRNGFETVNLRIDPERNVNAVTLEEIEQT
jgi:hypothetical protein